MNAKAEFEKFVVDQMAGFGPITQKRMFGGLAFYHNGLIFGMVIDDALFLKADDQSKQRFEAEKRQRNCHGLLACSRTLLG